MKYFVLLSSIFFALSCTTPSPQTLTPGHYKVQLTVKDQKQLPFIMQVFDATHLTIFNAEEVIEVDEVWYTNDSVFIQPPVFEGTFKGILTANGLQGVFVKESYDRVLPFVATKNVTERFAITSSKDPQDFGGIWEADFGPNDDNKTYKAKGIFTQKGNSITGTFRTPTGDYRFLEGVVDGDSLKLSAFDGAHSFLFLAKMNQGSMEGQFYSDNHWKEPFTAVRNESFSLPDVEKLTYLKEGYDQFSFSFPDKDGTFVSLEDQRFNNKAVVVQIMGSWCPNCLEESMFYSQYARENSTKDLAFVALAFEVAKTPEKAFSRIARLQQRIDIPYPILLAQYGSSDKVLAQEKLPMLNHVLSYPTTIFIDKKGNVRKIHTGFNGKATGEKYTSFVQEFDAFVTKLANEY